MLRENALHFTKQMVAERGLTPCSAITSPLPTLISYGPSHTLLNNLRIFSTHCTHYLSLSQPSIIICQRYIFGQNELCQDCCVSIGIQFLIKLEKFYKIMFPEGFNFFSQFLFLLFFLSMTGSPVKDGALKYILDVSP